MWEYNEKVSELFPKRYKEDIRMAQVNKSTMIGELLQIDQNIAPILLNVLDAHLPRWKQLKRQLWFTELIQML
jgi:hypothetical protein